MRRRRGDALRRRCRGASGSDPLPLAPVEYAEFLSKIRMSREIEEQERECARLRALMHDAPLAEWSKDHRGHSAIVNHTRAWADRSREWMAACNKLDEMKRHVHVSLGATND
jgi:hypothetical protein